MTVENIDTDSVFHAVENERGSIFTLEKNKLFWCFQVTELIEHAKS